MTSRMTLYTNPTESGTIDTMKTFVIKMTIQVDRAIYEPYLPEHLRYLKELKQRGVLLLSGPFRDRTGGMVMIRAESWDEAEAIAQADPFIRSGVDSYELHEWILTDGEPDNIVLTTLG